MKNKFSILALALIPFAAVYARAEGDPCDPGIGDEAATDGGSTGATASMTDNTTLTPGSLGGTIRIPLRQTSDTQPLGENLTLTREHESGTFSLTGGSEPLGTYDRGEISIASNRRGSSTRLGVFGDSAVRFDGTRRQSSYGAFIGFGF